MENVVKNGKRSVTIAAVFCALCLDIVSARAQSIVTEKVLFNGTVYTMDSMLSVSAAVAVRDDKIIAVGTLADVKGKVGKNATMINMGGKWLLPGLVDSHNHAIKGGVRLITADVNDELMSLDALRTFAIEALKSGKGKRGDGLYITGFHSAQWLAVDMLDTLFNETPFKEMPVLLYGTDGHTAWANRTLLSRAGVDKERIESLPREQRVYYGVNKTGQPNGTLSEDAVTRVASSFPASTITPYTGALRAVNHLNSLGITAWLDPSAGTIDDALQNEYLTAYTQLAEKNLLTAHVAATVVANANEPANPQIRTLKNLQQKYQSQYVSVMGFKIFADGVLEFPTQTAALSLPYSNSGLYGSLMVDPQKFRSFVASADSSGLLIHIHAIGDRAVSVSLDAIATARKQNHHMSLTTRYYAFTTCIT